VFLSKVEKVSWIDLTVCSTGSESSEAGQKFYGWRVRRINVSRKVKIVYGNASARRIGRKGEDGET
jgi:hypothetical protein